MSLKRFLPVIPIAAVLSACAPAEPPAPAAAPDIAFSADADISYEGIDLSAKVTRTAAGEWELTVSEPYALEGLTMKISEDGTSLSMLGLEGSSDSCESAVSMARALACAYDAAAGSSLSGTSELGSYTVTLSEDACPAKLTAGGLKVKFNSFETVST